MKATALLLLLGAALLGFGSVSSHWFGDVNLDLTTHQGLLGGETCGPGRGVDELESYERAIERHEDPPPLVFTCDYDLLVTQVVELHGAKDIVEWSAMIFGLLAGLTTALVATIAGLRALAGRAAGRSTALTLVILPVVGAVCPFLVLLIGDLAGSKLEYGAGAYGAGALLSVAAGVRLYAGSRGS